MDSKEIERTREKGGAGEDWIDGAMGLFGWKAIKFDWWQASADRLYFRDGNCILAQCKNKEPRRVYPDTGLERSRFEAFKQMCADTGIPGMILFTDSTDDVYGEWLKNLKDESHPGQYNKKDGYEMIYFWLQDLKTIKELLNG